MTSSLIDINHESVSLTVAEIWPIEIFWGQFDLDLISQGHHKSYKWCIMPPSVIAINHMSVSLTVFDTWLVENFEGQFDLDLISQGHHKHAK